MSENVNNNVGRFCTMRRPVWFQQANNKRGTPRCWQVVEDHGATLTVRGVTIADADGFGWIMFDHDGGLRYSEPGHLWGLKGTVKLSEVTNLY